MDQTTVRVAKDALGANQTIAEANRADFDAAGVTVLNLMSAPGAGKTALEEYERYKEGEAQRVLEEAMEQVPAGVSADRSLVEGPPAETLAEAAQDLDLLFLGSRGYGPIKGALLGSVSATLMTSSPLLRPGLPARFRR